MNFTRLSSNVVFEELALSSLIASPLMKPLLTSGEWHELKDFSRFVVRFDVQDRFVFFNLSPLNTTVSRKVISFFDISATNLMVVWNLFACSIN